MTKKSLFCITPIKPNFTTPKPIKTRRIIFDPKILVRENLEKLEGIVKKLESGEVPLDDAIKELFKGKVTTNTTNHSGEGIFFTSQIMDKFYISSSNRIFTRSKLENDTLKCSNNNGTLVFMTLANRTRKSVSDVFNKYSSVDEGFNKTEVNIKSVFDNDPISRSQAKRLCQGLEKFDEIILDFEGVDFIGQGFAHQLFVVFQNLYPNIIIETENTNDNVLLMINHVKK